MDTSRKYTENFLRLLSKGPTSIPKGAQWVVYFESPGRLLKGGIKRALSYQTTNKADKWKIDKAIDALTVADYQDNAGCIFCAGIGVPGENLTVNPEGNIQQGAFIRSYVGQGRTSFPIMRMSFLDTNLSFADNFLRPWVVSTSTFGLVGRRRDSEENYRTEIHCIKLGGVYSEAPPRELIHWTFYDACCVAVSEEEYNYQPTSSPVMREAQFIYNSYSIETDQNPFSSQQSSAPPGPSMGMKTVQPQTNILRGRLA